MVVAEIEFGPVAMKALLPAVLINALHATLENREVAFDRVGMHGAIGQAHVFVGGMIHRFVPAKVDADDVVVACFVGEDSRFVRDVFLQNRAHGFPVKLVYHHAIGVPGRAVH